MKVLHLEDNSPLCEVLRSGLEVADPTIELTQYANSDVALAYALEYQNAIKLYILDISVQGSMSGLQVADSLRQNGVKDTIILTSAFQPPERKELERLQALWYAKPWHVFEITQKIIELANS